MALDDCTGNVTIQAQILDVMNQLKKKDRHPSCLLHMILVSVKEGTSILMALGVVAEVCDDVAVMYCGRVVERGDVKTIFANPSHPYTKGLLGSRDWETPERRKSIQSGNVPNPKYC